MFIWLIEATDAVRIQRRDTWVWIGVDKEGFSKQQPPFWLDWDLCRHHIGFLWQLRLPPSLSCKVNSQTLCFWSEASSAFRLSMCLMRKNSPWLVMQSVKSSRDQNTAASVVKGSRNLSDTTLVKDLTKRNTLCRVQSKAFASRFVFCHCCGFWETAGADSQES